MTSVPVAKLAPWPSGWQPDGGLTESTRIDRYYAGVLLVTVRVTRALGVVLRMSISGAS
jgi:hypothetical protein